MRIKLKPGIVLRDPQTKHQFKDEAEVEVPRNQFWQRRINEGAVVDITFTTPSVDQDIHKV